MDKRTAFALVVAAALLAVGLLWPDALVASYALLIWAPLLVIAVLTVGVWVARKLRI